MFRENSCPYGIQNIDDNRCFNWCLERYLNSVGHQPARIRKIEKLFGDELDFEEKNSG